MNIPKVPYAVPGTFSQHISQYPTVDPAEDTIDAVFPYPRTEDIDGKMIQYKKALNAPQSPENEAILYENLRELEKYKKMPEMIQEYYYEKEKYLYGLSQNVASTQKFMGDWMKDNGPNFSNWTESFVANTKTLDSWQGLIDVFNDYETECGVNHNERWNLQHAMSIVIPEIIPNIPVIEMPRWPNVALKQEINPAINAKIPQYNFTFQPISLPDAPIGTSAPPMPRIPKVPQLTTKIPPPSIDIPQLPDLPPAPKMPSLAPALGFAEDIFAATTKFKCLYNQVPIVPEWNA